MILPTADEVERAANMLARLAANDNPRPGDGWLSRDSQAEQFRVRALDMLTLMKNAPEILGDADPAPAESAPRRVGIMVAVGLAVSAAFAWGMVVGMGIMGA